MNALILASVLCAVAVPEGAELPKPCLDPRTCTPVKMATSPLTERYYPDATQQRVCELFPMLDEILSLVRAVTAAVKIVVKCVIVATVALVLDLLFSFLAWRGVGRVDRRLDGLIHPLPAGGSVIR